jgi:hypothetical protein
VLMWHRINEVRDDKSFMGVERVSWGWNSSALFSKYRCVENWVTKPPLRLVLGIIQTSRVCIFFYYTRMALWRVRPWAEKPCLFDPDPELSASLHPKWISSMLGPSDALNMCAASASASRMPTADHGSLCRCRDNPSQSLDATRLEWTKKWHKSLCFHFLLWPIWWPRNSE